MKKIAITMSEFYPGEAEAIVRALSDDADYGGFARVHIRKPGADPEQIAGLISQIPTRLRSRITIHDGFSAPGAGGVHLNSRNPQAPQGWSGLISRSLHTLAELEGVGQEVDYAFISPIYESLSKPGYTPAFTLARVAEAICRLRKHNRHTEIYGLGGVTDSNICKLASYGLDGGAMLTAAWLPRSAANHEMKTTDKFSLRDFALQLITHPYEGMGLADGARKALAGGCRWVQLRHKDAQEEILLEQGREIAAMCREYGAVFIVDDHVDLVRPLGADGVHLGKNDMPVAEARASLGPEAIIGATANTFADLRAAAEAGADYVGVGPFRFTQTKKNLSPILGLEGYRAIVEQCRRERITIPIVAIGGITPADIPAIMATGVGGIAASSTILSAPDPTAQTATLLASILESAQ